MNTRSFYDEAKKRKLSPVELMAHAAWSIVSQTGRAPLTVGEVCKMVALTSGIKPSTYQVRTLLEGWVESDTAHQQVLRKTPVAPVMGYTGGENLVLILTALVHVFYENDVLYQAIHTLTWPVKNQAIEVSNTLYNFNQEQDDAAKPIVIIEKGE